MKVKAVELAQYERDKEAEQQRMYDANSRLGAQH
tara:strand:+ start:261 stop:362 length:102 start_codon:yes stop_codon:yes gene_type:complete